MVGHRCVRPHRVEDFLLREEVVRTPDEEGQQAERLGLERQRDAAPLQAEGVQIEYEIVPAE